MKKIFTLLSAAMLTTGLSYAEEVTIMWPTATETEGIYAVDLNPIVTGDNAEFITANEITFGSNQTVKSGVRAWYGLNGMEVGYSGYTQNPSTDGSYYIQFPFTVANGKQFTVSEISFYGAKLGTNGEMRIDVFIADSENNQISIEEAIVLDRGVDSSAPADLATFRDYRQSDLEAIEALKPLTGENALTFNLYHPGKNSGKSTCYSTIIVKGEITAAGFVETRDKAPISWDGENISYKVRDDVSGITLPVLVNDENLELVFSSSDEEIATVDENGVVTLLNTKVGSAVISAAYQATDDSPYQNTTVEYTIEVLTNVVENHAWKEYENAGYIELDDIYLVPKNSDKTLAAGTLMDNDDITLSTIFKANYADSYASEYLGYKFESSAQIGRVKDAPTTDTPTGTENSGSSPLIVTAKKNLQLVMFYRRQALRQDVVEKDDVENNIITQTTLWGMDCNDGKDVRCVAQDDVDNNLDKELVFGRYCNDECKGKDDYLDCAAIWNLEAGKTYTFFATGTTICTNGIGYATEKDPDEIVFRTNVIEYKENAESQTDGNGFTVSRTGGKLSNGSTKINVDGVEYTPIKMKGLVTADKNQIVYTIAAPEGRIITKATVYAYMSYIGKEGEVDATDASQNYFSEVAGHTFVKDLHGKFTNNTTDVKEFTFDHIMRNSFDIKLHSNQDADICAVWVVETTHDRHAVAAPAVILEGEDEVTEEVELSGIERVVTVVPADGHHAYYHFDYAKTETVVTPEKPEPGFEESEEFLSPAPAPARAEAAGDAPAQVITVNGKEFRLVPEEGLELAKNGTLAVLAHNPANGLKSEVKTINVTGTAPETTMIESVAVDNAAAEVEYYNLQGIRVNNPQGGVFIRRQGNDVKKVIL